MKLLLYCTKGKLSLRKSIKDKDYYLDNGSEFNIIPKKDYVLNGKIVAECDFEVEEIEKGYGTHHASFDERGCFDDYYDYMTKTLDEDILLKRSCLNVEELENYNPNYAIHIKNLHIFDYPKETGRYSTRTRKVVSDIICDSCTAFGFDCRKCPDGYDYQNVGYVRHMMKVYGRTVDSEYIAIPVTPEEMCRIANGEQTVLVRRTVLKEMIK